MHETFEGRDVSNGSSSFLIGMLCGAAVGAAVGLLMAPKAGPQLRRQLWESTEGLRQRASDAYDGASSVVNDAITRGRQAVEAGRETFQRNRPTNGPTGDVTSSMP